MIIKDKIKKNYFQPILVDCLSLCKAKLAVGSKKLLTKDSIFTSLRDKP